MAQTLHNDGLLKAARVLITLLQIILGVAFLGMFIAIPIILFSQAEIADDMVVDATMSAASVATILVAIFAVVAAVIAAGFYFLRLLKQIVNSVSEGDPFIIQNADRLTKMGWITVAIQLLMIPVITLSYVIAAQVEPESWSFDMEFSFTGLLLALVLFILARVFRHGAAMREDLEGTV